jgi:hypothetical protein
MNLTPLSSYFAKQLIAYKSGYFSMYKYVLQLDDQGSIPVGAMLLSFSSPQRPDRLWTHSASYSMGTAVWFPRFLGDHACNNAPLNPILSQLSSVRTFDNSLRSSPMSSLMAQSHCQFLRVRFANGTSIQTTHFSYNPCVLYVQHMSSSSDRLYKC